MNRAERSERSAWEVLTAFLKLGLTSFGGPIAHLGYFRSEFVVRRRWLDEPAYGDLLALCQFLPGPASSQVGFALGLQRAGPLGAAAAWTGFTLPSAVLMIAFAYGAAKLSTPVGSAALHGLKIVAVAIVAQAVWGMARSLAPDRARALIAVGAVVLVTAGPAFGQLAALALGALIGLVVCRGPLIKPTSVFPIRLPRWVGVLALVVFIMLLIGASLPYAPNPAAFYRAGALVFGGGHVVLPLLQASVVQNGDVGQQAFLAGYGAAQAVPGPLFTFAAYLGAISHAGPGGVAGAALALLAVFLPGLLLLVGVLPFWEGLRRRPLVQAAMRGANAAVVGVLAAALYSPVWTSAVLTPRDFALAASGFVALTALRIAPVWIVLATTLTVALLT